MANYSASLIGDRIRVQRRRLHMSLDDLGARTKLSKSFLSQVERGMTSPSIESLSQIAGAIGVPMFLLFAEDNGHQIIRRRGEHSSLSVPDSRFRYESVWFGTNRRMEIIIGHLQPGQSSSDHPRGHSTTDMMTVDECAIVLQGKVEFELDNDVHILETGDSAYFAGNLPHRYSAIGGEEVLVLFAITPPAVAR